VFFIGYDNKLNLKMGFPAVNIDET